MNIEKANVETAFQSFHENSPREAKYMLDNLQGDLQTTNMMDTDLISATESLAPYLRDKQIINSCKYQLTSLDSEIETNNGHGSVGSYGQLYMPIQYSVLSLKVDLDPTAELNDPSKIKTDDEYDVMEFYDVGDKIISNSSQPEYGVCLHLIESREKINNSQQC